MEYGTSEKLPKTFIWIGRIQTVIYLLLGLAIILLLWFAFQSHYYLGVCDLPTMFSYTASISIRGKKCFPKSGSAGNLDHVCHKFRVNFDFIHA